MLRPVRSRSRTTALPRSRLRRGIPPKPGIKPEAQLGKAETRHFVGDYQIAGERQLESAAECHAVYGGDSGERSRVDRIHHAMNSLEEIAHTCETRAGRHRLRTAIQFAQIGAGAKAFLAIAGNNQRVSFGLQRLKRRGEFLKFARV